MAALIGALRATLSADTANFEQGMRRAQGSAQQAERGIKGSMGRISGVVKAGLAGLASGLTVGLFTDAVKGALDYAGSLGELAQQLGVTTKDLQVFRYAAGQNGVSTEEMDRALGKLTVTLGQVAVGAKAPTKALQAIGISARDLAGKDTGTAFRMIADGLQKVTDRSQRAAVEVALFGRTGAKLDTLLAGGSSGINQLSAAAEKLGIVLSDEQIRKADETADKLDALKTVLKAQIAGAVANNADSILGLANALVSLVASIGDAMRGWQKFKTMMSVPLKVGEMPWTTMARAGRAVDFRNNMIAMNPRPAAPVARSTAGREVGDFLAGGQGGSKQRTDKQAYDAFLRELRNLGITPTSGKRSTQQQAALYRRLGPGNAAPPGTSDHEFWKAMDFGVSVDPAKIALAASRADVSLGKPLIHGGKGNLHRHQPFSKGGASGGGEADLANQIEEAQRRRLDALNKAHDFAQDQLRGEADILSAQASLATDYVERAGLEQRLLDLKLQEELNELAHQQELFKQTAGEEGISAAQAAVKEAQLRRVHALETQAIIDEEQAERRRESAELDQVDFDLQRQALEAQANMAETASERRDAEFRLLDLIQRQEKARLEAVLADEKSGHLAQEEARRRLAAMPGQNKAARAQAAQGTRGPLEAYYASLPVTAEKMNEALQNVAVNGLQSLEDGLMSIIEGTESVGEAFRKMAQSILSDLIRISLQKLIIAPLTNAIMGGMGVGGVPAFATGGSFSVGGNHGRDRNLLSLNGLPIARVSHGERVSVSNDDTPMQTAVGGGSFTFNFPGVTNSREARQSGLQAANAFRGHVARSTRANG